jgi:hypothetical protein
MAMTVENLTEFNSMLNDLDVSIRKEVMKKGYSAAVKPLISAAKEGIPNIHRLQKSLGSKYYADSNSAEVGARKGRYAGFFANFFEEGTKDRQTKTQTKIFKRKRTGHPTGHITATHFWKNAMDSTEAQVFDGMYQAFIDTYNKVVRKYERFFR